MVQHLQAVEALRNSCHGQPKIRLSWAACYMQECSRSSLEQCITDTNASCQLCAPTQAPRKRLSHFVKHLAGTHPLDQTKSAARQLPAAFVMPHGAQGWTIEGEDADRSQTAKARIFSPDRVCLVGALGKWGTGLILTIAPSHVTTCAVN